MGELACLTEPTVQLIPPSYLPTLASMHSLSVPLPLWASKSASAPPLAAAKHNNMIHPFTCPSSSLLSSPACAHITICNPALHHSHHSCSLSVSSSYFQLHERATFSISCKIEKRSIGGRHESVLAGEVSHWGPGCVYSQLHGSNQPDAPWGDERASAAVSLSHYYFMLHKRSMKREEEGG